MSGDDVVLKSQHTDTVAEQNLPLRIGSGRVAQFILGTIPNAGGVGALLAAEANARRDARLSRLLDEITGDLSDLNNRGLLDEQFLDSDTFLTLLVGMMQQAAKSVDPDRITHLRKFIAAVSMTSRPDVGWLELFQRYVGDLSGAHGVCLQSIYQVQRDIAASDRLGHVRVRGVPVPIKEIGTDKYPLELRRICAADLNNLGLLVDWRMLSGEGDSHEAYCLSRNGLLFMRFLLGEWSGNNIG